MKKKKTLHLLSSGKYSGAENVACTIINNIDEISYYCSPKGPVEKVLEEKNINYIPIKKLSARELKKIIREYDIDILHAHDFKASFIASFLSKKVTIISQLHCNYDFIKKWNIYTIIYSIIQKKFKKIIVVSQDILNEAIFKNKIKDKTVVIDNVVDPKEVKRKSLEIKTNNYDLIFVGRLVDVKRPLFFLEIIKEIKAKNKNIKACILGCGELYDDCEKYIKINQLEKNIDLLGFVNNPYPYVKNSTVEVLPSKFEGLPMSTIEAMILGTPVINSGVNGLGKMFSNHKEYICNTKEEYIKIINNILTKKNTKYKKDCEEIIKKYTDIKSYINQVKKVHNNN